MTEPDGTKQLLGRSKTVLSEVHDLLKTPIPEHGPDIAKHLTEIDAYFFTCMLMAAQLHGAYRMIEGKSDRKQAIRMVAESCDAAAEGIKRRVSLGQTMMNYQMEELRANMKA